MRAVVDGRLRLSDSVRSHLDLCLDCRSCETACPSGVQYGRLIEQFRVEIAQWDAVTERPDGRSWLERQLLFRLLAFPKRLWWALAPVRILQFLRLDRILAGTQLTRMLPRILQRVHRLLPPPARRVPKLPEFLPAQGTRRARVALFTGCAADVLSRQVHWATTRVLQANGCDVLVPRSQVCCGAIHYRNGAKNDAFEFAIQNAAAFPLDEIDAVVVNVAGCGTRLKDYGRFDCSGKPVDEEQTSRLTQFADKVRDVSEFLVELGPVAPSGAIPIRAAYHDACHLTHGQGLSEPPRDLLALVPGLELVGLVEPDVCCGAAGSYNLTQPEMADRLCQRKLRHILDTNAQAVITGDVGCALQIQAALRQSRRRLWVAHPMEILDLSYRQLPPP